ncbi:6-bladed beta-propeller [Albibacterium sp.]|uniref:6-bladed beta-propeller n=1 Tax=Albibacterium sp. TaxID=2952885 RepID=UPI002C64C50C|nr:6-bladed beta-propeller [Albibacterium sp.]HUH18115.1 6-bladed beta-propeller [Albibacterium sp.]
MKQKFQNLVVFLLLLTSCALQNNPGVVNKNLIKISVQPNDEREDDALIDLVQEHKYIKLETKKESLVSRIDKILFFNNKCLILDKTSKAIFIFDINGKYLTKVQYPGKGPGEYSSIIDFDIDEKGTIYALDITRNSIFKYDIEGKFIEVNKLDHFSKNLAIVDSSKVITFHPISIETIPTGTLVMNMNNVVHPLLPFEGHRGSHKKISFLNSFALTNSENILFSEDLSDTIYEISKDGLQLKAKYFIDFGKRALSEELRKNPDYFFMSPTLIDEGWHISNYFENSKYFTCSFNLEGKTWVLFYHKKNKTYTFSSCVSCNAQTPRIISDMVVAAIYDDYFVSVVPNQFLSSNKSYLDQYPDRPNSFTSDSYHLIKSFENNDNPVLVLFKL